MLALTYIFQISNSLCNTHDYPKKCLTFLHSCDKVLLSKIFRGSREALKNQSFDMVAF